MPPAVLTAAATGAAFGAIGLSTVTIAGSAIIGGAVVYGGLALANHLVSESQRFDGGTITVGTNRPDVRQLLRAATTPARWVPGRARTSGLLVYLFQNPHNEAELHLMLVLCEGPIEGIERVWVDGDELDGSAGLAEDNDLIEPIEGSRYHNHLSIRVFTNGAANARDLQNAGRETPESEPTSQWTAQHKLEGKACVHITMTQNNYREADDVERLYYRIPQFEFQIKGLKFTHPNSLGEPTWTDNAAAIRYWWLTQRRGVPQSAIDSASYLEAYNTCETIIEANLPTQFREQGFATDEKRYSINGVITSTDNHESVEREMDFAWAGYVVEQGGTHYFRPGADRPPKRSIGDDDIISRGTIQPAPALTDRVNAATMRIAQSIQNGYTELALPEFQDTEAIRRDGRKLPKDFGSRSFVSSPTAAGRLLAVQLRRSRANAIYTYKVSPSWSMKYFDLIPTDKVWLTDSKLGLTNHRCVITRKTVNPDFTIDLTLENQPDGTFADSTVLPPLRGTPFNKISGIPNLQGRDGVDGEGLELIFAVSSGRRPTLPSNNWGYDQPQAPWSDGAPSLTANNNLLWRSARRVLGQPAVGTSIPFAWSSPVVVGRFGSDGIAGLPGADGSDGAAGTDGAGIEYIFARTNGSTPSLPSNSWGFDRPQGVWFDAAPSLSSSINTLWSSQRFVVGNPAVGASVPATWTAPAIVGRWGPQGLRGPQGVPGPAAPRIWQRIYTGNVFLTGTSTTVTLGSTINVTSYDLLFLTIQFGFLAAPVGAVAIAGGFGSMFAVYKVSDLRRFPQNFLMPTFRTALTDGRVVTQRASGFISVQLTGTRVLGIIFTGLTDTANVKMTEIWGVTNAT